MSCGRHHQTQCQEVLLRVYEFLDSEMTDADTVKIRQHLDECAPCLREYGIEEEVKLLVKRSHPCDSPPVGLRERVILGIVTTAGMTAGYGSAGAAGSNPSIGGPAPGFPGGLPGTGPSLPRFGG